MVKPKKKGGLSPISARVVRGSDNEEKCLELRAENKSLREIGAILGLSHAGVAKAILRGMKNRHDPEIANSVRLQSIERYDLLIEADLYKALDGDKAARARVLEVMLAQEKVAGCHVELPQERQGAAVAFNYYMPTVETDPLAHVEKADFELPQREIKLPAVSLMRNAGEITPTPQT